MVDDAATCGAQTAAALADIAAAARQAAYATATTW